MKNKNMYNWNLWKECLYKNNSSEIPLQVLFDYCLENPNLSEAEHYQGHVISSTATMQVYLTMVILAIRIQSETKTEWCTVIWNQDQVSFNKYFYTSNKEEIRKNKTNWTWTVQKLGDKLGIQSVYLDKYAVSNR
jgi:hypothetical protein